MLGIVDETVETIRAVAQMALAHSTGCSCHFQRTTDAFHPRRMRRTLTALALAHAVGRYCRCLTGGIPWRESIVVELDRDHALEDWEG
jgi:hypothetical protein